MHRRLMAVGQRGIAVRALGGNRAGEMRLTRLLRNPKVSVEKIVEHARARAASRVAGRHIVAIQDTTSLRDDGAKHSIQAHPTIAVDAETGALLGLVHGEILIRNGGLKARRKKRAFDDKQSRRWLDGAEAAAAPGSPWPAAPGSGPGQAPCLGMKPVGKPDAGNPHVRLDERGGEPE